MRQEKVEILSDETDMAVIRHPDRRYPGILVQGDTLLGMCQQADFVAKQIGRSAPGYANLNELRNQLWSLLSHYKAVLEKHKVELPFSETPDG